jgi:hypothetical protein
LKQRVQFSNSGQQPVVVTFPVVQSKNFAMRFRPPVLTVPRATSEGAGTSYVTVRLELFRPTPVYELIDFVVGDCATLFFSLALDAVLLMDVDPSSIRFDKQVARGVNSRTFRAEYAGQAVAVKVVHEREAFQREDLLLRSLQEHRALLTFIGSCEQGVAQCSRAG